MLFNLLRIKVDEFLRRCVNQSSHCPDEAQKGELPFLTARLLAAKPALISGRFASEPTLSHHVIVGNNLVTFSDFFQF